MLIKVLEPAPILEQRGEPLAGFNVDVGHRQRLFYRRLDPVELHEVDGTAAGTKLVRDIDPGGSSYPYSLTNVAGTLFFAAADGTHGTELWKAMP